MAIEIGSRVAYSKKWLQSTGTYTGPLPFARGTVTGFRNWGTKIAIVDWNNPEIPEHVNVSNLVTIKQVQCGE
jgi:hypothetical protein